MLEDTLTILGLPVKFQFHIYDTSYVSWNLHPDSKGNSPLLEILLRIHYQEYIEAMLREVWFRQIYENSQFDPTDQSKLF